MTDFHLPTLYIFLNTYEFETKFIRLLSRVTKREMSLQFAQFYTHRLQASTYYHTNDRYKY